MASGGADSFIEQLLNGTLGTVGGYSFNLKKSLKIKLGAGGAEKWKELCRNAEKEDSDEDEGEGEGCTPSRIQIQCIRPELLSGEDFDNILETEGLDLAKIVVTENIDVTSPLSSLGGEGTAYYFDQMQVETCATPMGLAMQEGDVVALWNPSKFPKGTDGKKKRRIKEKLKDGIIELTSNIASDSDYMALAKGDQATVLTRGLNPLVSASKGTVAGTVGLAFPPELVTHTSSCTSKEEVDALLKRISDSKSKMRTLSVSEVKWARTKLLMGVELDLGFSTIEDTDTEYSTQNTDGSPTGTPTYLQHIWVKSENEKLFKKVIFTMHVMIDGVPQELSKAATSSPFVFYFTHCTELAFKVNFEILFCKPDGENGSIKVEHEFGELDRDEQMNLKWRKTLDMGDLGRKMDIGKVKDDTGLILEEECSNSFCLPGLATEMGPGMEDKFKNICEVIKALVTWSNKCQIEGCHEEQLKKPDTESPCRIMQGILKYCARRFEDMCIVDLLASQASTFCLSPGEWMRWGLYVGPVRNGTRSKRKSLLPVVRLCPHLAKGTVDDMVRIWKHYSSMRGFRVSEVPSWVTYNGKQIEVGSNTKVTDVIDRSLSKHYFAIPLPGTDTRSINQLIEFIEGNKEAGEQKKKKRKSRKKELKSTLKEEVDIEDLDQVKSSSQNMEAYDPNTEERMETEEPISEEGKVTPIEVFVSHVTVDGKLFACDASDKPALDSLMVELNKELATNPTLAGAHTPKIGDICATRFNDNQWCRVIVEKILNANKVYVHYIDYGHSTFVQKTKLRALPATFTEAGAYAKQYCMALVNLPRDEELAVRGVGLLYQKFVACHAVKLRVEYMIGSDTFVSVHIGDEDVGKKLVEDGLLLVDRQGGPKLEKLVKEYEEAMDRAKKNRLNIWRKGDITRGDSGESGATCKSLSMGGFGFVDLETAGAASSLSMGGFGFVDLDTATSSVDNPEEETVSKSKNRKKKNKPGLSEPDNRKKESKVPETDQGSQEGDINISHVVDEDIVVKSKNRKKRNKSGLSVSGNREIEGKVSGTDQDVKEGDVNICHGVQQGELVTYPMEDTNIQAVKEEMGSKEEKLGQLEFMEGTETGAQRKKKKKSRKKASVKETPEEASDKGTGEVARILENTKLDSDGPGLNTHDGGTRLKSRKCKRTDNLGEKEGDVNTHNEGGQDERVSFLHGLDSTEDPNIQALKDELAITEAKLGELLDSSQAFVEMRGKEMSLLISAVEDAEEEKHSMLKQVAQLEAEMNNLRDELVRMQDKRDQLMKDVEEKDEILKESLKKKKQLEDLIETEVDANKQSRRQLEKEIGSLQARIDDLAREEANMSNIADKANLEAQRFLLNIDKKIEAKESDLECPVCMEVSTAPIFSCDEQHIICSDCRPKVSICPECREPYPDKPRRHRYAEKAAKELEALILERAELLNSV